MAYNEKLNDRIRGAIAHLTKVEEKFMFGGTCFMLKGKMCVGVVKDEMTCLPVGRCAVSTPMCMKKPYKRKVVEKWFLRASR
jgi:hypothetical protein